LIDELIAASVFCLALVLLIYLAKSVIRFAGYLKSRPKYVTMDEFNRTVSLISRRMEAERKETESKLKKAISSIPIITKIHSLPEYVCKVIRRDREYLLECECAGVPFFKKEGFKDERDVEEWFRKHNPEIRTHFKNWLKKSR